MRAPDLAFQGYLQRHPVGMGLCSLCQPPAPVCGAGKIGRFPGIFLHSCLAAADYCCHMSCFTAKPSCLHELRRSLGDRALQGQTHHLPLPPPPPSQRDAWLWEKRSRCSEGKGRWFYVLPSAQLDSTSQGQPTAVHGQAPSKVLGAGRVLMVTNLPSLPWVLTNGWDKATGWSPAKGHRGAAASLQALVQPADASSNTQSTPEQEMSSPTPNLTAEHQGRGKSFTWENRNLQVQRSHLGKFMKTSHLPRSARAGLVHKENLSAHRLGGCRTGLFTMPQRHRTDGAVLLGFKIRPSS